MPVILALGKMLKKEDAKYEATLSCTLSSRPILGYILIPYLIKPKAKQKI